MFDYTKAVFSKTLSDLKLFEKIWSISTLEVYIAYLIYAIASGTGILIANIVLLTLSSLYFVFYLVMTVKGSELLKSKRKLIKKTYKYSKYIINAATLATVLYAIARSPYNVHPFKLIVTFFMTMLLLIQFVLEISIAIIEKRFNMFLEAFRADVEFVTKPVNTVKNVFKRITGQEVQPEEEHSKDRVYLDSLVQKKRDEKSSEKTSDRSVRKEKISSWLDSRISKISIKRKSNTDKEDNSNTTDLTEYEIDTEEKV